MHLNYAMITGRVVAAVARLFARLGKVSMQRKATLFNREHVTVYSLRLVMDAAPYGGDYL